MRPGAMPQQQQQQQQQHGQSLPPPRAPYNNRAEEHDGSLVPESWVEVSSHPSSSSVSSIGDEIVTTGLRVGNSYQPRRRRPQPRSNTNPASQQQRQYPTSASAQAALAGASSQEEYEESDSEDDRVLTSSTENITSPQGPGSAPLQQVLPGARRRSADSDSSDDDENATALGRRPAEPFRPQPNAFTHPPSHLSHRHSASSAIPDHHPRPPSFSQRASTRFDRRASNFMTPADNDAALRASLTTLLSCAAAARGRPKEGEQEKGETAAAARPAAPAVSNQPVGLRMMSESELNVPSPVSPALAAQPSSTRQRETPQPSSSSPKPSRRATPPPGGEKIKRSATPGTSGSKPPRATKKKKTTATATAADDEGAATLISPTLLTWVVSAGVVVLVSVVGFGAGYVIGREVGRQEALSSGGSLGGLAGNASSGGSCGAEVIRSGGSAAGGGTLRRFRWGGGVSSIAA